MTAKDALLAAERAKMEAEVAAEVTRLSNKRIADEMHAQSVLDDLENETFIQQEAATIEERRKQAQIASQLRPVNVQRPTDKEIIAAISEKFGVSTGKACDWILEVAEAMRRAA